MKNGYPNLSTLLVVLIGFIVIPTMGLVFDNDGKICELLLQKCEPQSAQIFYIGLICVGVFWGIVEIIQYLRGSLDKESINDSKNWTTHVGGFYGLTGFEMMIDSFSKRENSGNSLEGKIKLYGVTIFFFIAWGFLAYCFYVIQPDNIIQAIVAGLIFTWVIGLYPLIRGILYLNDKLQNWINEE